MIPYGFAGVCFWPGDITYVRVGAGTSATFWALTPGAEVSWRRDYNIHGKDWEDYWSLSVFLGIGGWYSF